MVLLLVEYEWYFNTIHRNSLRKQTAGRAHTQAFKENGTIFREFNVLDVNDIPEQERLTRIISIVIR